jgi:HK97 family phage major capsid protein
MSTKGAAGFAENQPSQAGFLVPQQTAAGIIEKMYKTGTILSLFTNKDSVQGNNMSYNAVDETSRANGSRMGGFVSYWLPEAGTFTASTPKFRQIELKLSKVTAMCVATDEQLADAPLLESWMMRNAPEELRFRVEQAIVTADGVGKPLGLLASPALKSATRVDASKISATDIGNMWAARWAGLSDYVWLGNQSIFPQLLTMTVGQQPVFLPAGGLGGMPYATLLGRPYFDIEYAPSLGTLGDLMLVSPSQYQLIDKAGGIASASSIHVYFATGQQAFRWEYRIAGAPTWTSTLTGFDGATYSPYVVLAATT